jgi:hypothetical protein
MALSTPRVDRPSSAATSLFVKPAAISVSFSISVGVPEDGRPTVGKARGKVQGQAAPAVDVGDDHVGSVHSRPLDDLREPGDDADDLDALRGQPGTGERREADVIVEDEDPDRPLTHSPGTPCLRWRDPTPRR